MRHARTTPELRIRARRAPDRRPSLRLQILLEDNHCLAILKPAGVLVQPDRTGDPTVVDLVRDLLRERDRRPGNVYVGVVHRLDRPVSGALLLARTSKAAERLAAQFRAASVEKKYLALVEHSPVEPDGTLVHRLVKDRDENRVRIAESGDPEARIARLEYHTLGPRAGGILLEVRPHTGRAHQIRVQLAASGCPIVGDLRYGSRRALGPMIALHAEELAFTHPTRAERVVVRAPLPETWSELIGS